jgi:Uncharacterized conserved protein (DUF2304)
VIAAALSLLSSAAPAAELTPLLERQRLVAVLVASGVLVLVIELVRRRKLREEYSWVWVATSLVLIALAASSDLLHTLSSWIGAASSVSTLFFGAFVFLLALVLQFSVRLSRLTHRHRTLAQRMALLEEEVRRLRQVTGTDSPVERESRSDRATGNDNDEVA